MVKCQIDLIRSKSKKSRFDRGHWLKLNVIYFNWRASFKRSLLRCVSVYVTRNPKRNWMYFKLGSSQNNHFVVIKAGKQMGSLWTNSRKKQCSRFVRYIYILYFLGCDRDSCQLWQLGDSAITSRLVRRGSPKRRWYQSRGNVFYDVCLFESQGGKTSWPFKNRRCMSLIIYTTVQLQKKMRGLKRQNL